MTYQQRRKFLSEVKHYFWDDPLLFKLGVDGIHRRCIPEDEMSSVMFHCHSSPYGGHSATDKTVAKILEAGFFWPALFKDVRNFVKACDKCQRMRIISRRNEMPQKVSWRLNCLLFGE
jgi:Integrase zinc binding domain